MKIPAIYYYLGVTGLFLLFSYFAHDTEYFNYMPLFLLTFGFGGSALRYSDSIGDLNTHLQLYHRGLYNKYGIKWEYLYKLKNLHPTAVFSPEMKQIDDPDLQEISKRVKMNLLFLVISFASLPILILLIMSWR